MFKYLKVYMKFKLRAQTLFKKLNSYNQKGFKRKFKFNKEFNICSEVPCRISFGAFDLKLWENLLLH